MLPRWHVLSGAVFTFLLWIISPGTNLFYLGLVFLSSVFIDFDHYICAVMRTGKMGLPDAFLYHEKAGKEHMKEHAKGIRRKGDFHLFHTIEFHVLIGILGIFLTPFFYIFIGMVFHSLLDVYDMMQKGVLYRREYFFFKWLGERF